MASNSTTLAPYLQELIQNRPSSRLKLLAAWDGLSIETQIQILDVIEHIPHELKLKALASPNAYIRHLVAEYFCYFHKSAENEKELLHMISHDKNALVNFTHSPNKNIHDLKENKYILNPKKFFSMSKDEQILYLSKRDIRDGDEISEIIQWGLQNIDLEENHLNSLVNEYAANFKEFKHFTCDYDYHAVKGLEALWRLVPKLKSAAKKFIGSLPTGIYDNEIPLDVLELLDQPLLTKLFYRQDLYLSEFRKKIVYSSNNQYSEQTRVAAAEVNLGLNNNDIQGLIKNNNLDVINIIIKSGGDGEYGFNYGHSPVFIHALIDHQNFKNEKHDGGEYHYGFENFFSLKTDGFTESEKKRYKKRELCELAIYFIARSAAPWNVSDNSQIDHIPEKLAFLKNKIIKNNPWETYLSFLSALRSPERYIKSLLPYVNHERLYPAISIAPSDPSELFGDEGREGNFMEDKIDYLYQEIKNSTSSMIAHLYKLKNYALFLLIAFFVLKIINKF